MSESALDEAWLEASAAALGLPVSEAWHANVLLHARLLESLAREFIDREFDPELPAAAVYRL